MEMSALLIVVFGSILPVVELLSLFRIANGHWDWVLLCVLAIVLFTEALIFYAAFAAQHKNRQGAMVASIMALAINVGFIVFAMMLSASIAGHMH
jgi:Kef-type K+ transport system membrane component KefB